MKIRENTVDQSMISICDVKNMFGGETKKMILRILYRLQCKLIISIILWILHYKTSVPINHIYNPLDST
jgi:hypothetical protein